MTQTFVPAFIEGVAARCVLNPMPTIPQLGRWSSKFAFYLVTVGASVGLGSIWRFPYMTGANGGGVFVFFFILACLAIATPLLVGEFLIGRRSRRSPPEAAGAMAAQFGGSRYWNAIGIIGSAAAFLIMSYYTVIAGWVLAYAWKAATGGFHGLVRDDASAQFQQFLSSPLRIGAWHLAFIVLVGWISARGVNRGIELANKVRAPVMLILLLILVAYALTTGDAAQGIRFAFSPDFSQVSAKVILAAIGQAFYATGVGMAMMIAYGAYVPAGASLVRTALVISGAILLVSVLATLIVFPLVFQYHLNPAQGAELVFNVLPVAFAEMPGGRIVGTLFFLLLVFAALTPSLAGIEPLVAWLEQRHGLSRSRASLVASASIWVLGIGSVLSFNKWAQWHPFAVFEPFRRTTVFDTLDFASTNILLPIGGFLTCVFIGWRLPKGLGEGELSDESVTARRLVILLLRYVCPLAILAVLISALAACSGPPSTPKPIQPTANPIQSTPNLIQPTSLGAIDSARLAHADAEPGQCFTTGRDAGGSYFSPLTDINIHSVGKLGFAWSYDLHTSRGLQASPIVVDGVMFAAGNFGRVYAVDAATGAEHWTFIPSVDMQWARYACCDAVNRGIAVWKGRVYVAAIDGYLYSLDANTGNVLWKADTLLGREQHIPYTITGAPVITQDAVVIGNGGADFAGVRGFISAFDLDSGHLKWRFFTVPKDPALGAQDQPHLAEAIKTWDPRHPWKFGGGGTVWDGLSYDSKNDLVFMGTANVSPYNTHADGRKGGDELYTCSVIAVHAGSGTLAWHFQEVPDDRWDFDSTQKFILTTLNIAGVNRDVLLHAAKNGYFYVYDRNTGAVLAANNFAFVNCTKGLDPITHRPIPNAAADYDKKPALVWPSAVGAHSWQPMSFNPVTRLVYIPALEMPNVMIDIPKRPAKEVDGWFSVQGIMPGDYDPPQMTSLYGLLPTLQSLKGDSRGSTKPQGMLTAWDPVDGRMVWQVPAATIWDGGVMSTPELVFRGDARGFLKVYDAKNGSLIKTIDVGSSIMAAPMTYKINNEQYVAFMAGYGGAGGFLYAPGTAAYKYGNAGRVVALKLGGEAVPIPPEVVDAPFPQPSVKRASPSQTAKGEILYNRVCNRCHVFGRGMLPDLRC